MQRTDHARRAGAVLAALFLTLPVVAQTEEGRLEAVDGASGDDFGAAVSIDGDVAVVGAPEDDDAGPSSGSAYVYRYDGMTWSQEQKLTAPDAATGDDFGFSVAISADTIVVGSPRDDTIAGSRAGSAYVYRYDPGVMSWVLEDHLFAADAAADDRFGYSVSIDGGTLLVGAINDDDGLTNAGAGYVFIRTGVTWTQQDKLTAAAPTGTSPHLGHSASVAGDVAVLGAWQDAPPGMFSVGAAYVFRRAGAVWPQEQKLTASDAADFRWFGQSVAVSGPVIAVGAYGDRAKNLSESGGAYFFRFNGALWLEEANVNASDAAADDRFGWSIALVGDAAIVGTGTLASKAYLFENVAGAWSEQAMLNSGDPDVTLEYAYAVALDGTRAVVGDRGGFTGTGLGFVFNLGGGSCAGDTSGDGTVDVIDLLGLLAAWGTSSPTHDIAPPPNGDGIVDVQDLLLLLAQWGPCP